MSDDAKAQLRAELRERRRQLRRLQPDAARLAADGFDAARLPPFQIAAVYRAIGAELDPLALAERLQAEGAQVALPSVVAAGQPLVFRLVGDHELIPDVLGIHAPPPHASEVRPELVVAPLLAFDGRGGRLGQGGGFYDRTLAALRARGRAVFALGLAYAGQEVEALPVGPFDQRLDGVLTEAGLRLFATE